MRPTQSSYPGTRLRRVRKSPAMRALVRENYLDPGDFIWPVFVRQGEGIEEPVPSMPGVVRRSVDRIADHRPPRAFAGRFPGQWGLPAPAGRRGFAQRRLAGRSAETAKLISREAAAAVVAAN